VYDRVAEPWCDLLCQRFLTSCVASSFAFTRAELSTAGLVSEHPFSSRSVPVPSTPYCSTYILREWLWVFKQAYGSVEFLGVPYLSSSSHFCCSRTVQATDIQSHQARGKFEAPCIGTARCSGVGFSPVKRITPRLHDIQVLEAFSHTSRKRV
jgi:hypothetical protein